MIAIINSSPLIYLGKVGLLNLLQQLFDRVLTVETVREEVLDLTAPEFAVLQSAFADWLLIQDVPKSPLSARLGDMGLHQGEIDALVLGYHMEKRESDSVMVIDDLAGREVARTLGLRVTGTIGVILRAKKTGLLTKEESLTKIRSLIEDTSFWMSAALYSKILADLE